MYCSCVTMHLATSLAGLILVLRNVTSLQLLGAIDVQRCAFSTLFVDEQAGDVRDTYSILLSTFNPAPLTVDTSYIARNIGRYLDVVNEAPLLELYDQFSFPREISQVPDDVFGFSAIAQPEGFLTPTKNDGTVYIINVQDMANPILHDITAGREDQWFYHRVIWKDMDGDGLSDAITCRANFDLNTGEADTELLWLKHPADPFSVDWPVTVISTDTCDTFARLVEIDGVTYLFTVGYFTHMLAVHWSNHPSGQWANPDDIEMRIIDTGHQFFDINIDDVNNDGDLDLVVTLNAAVNGSLVAYEIPADIRNGEFERHVLAYGFVARSGVGGGGAPGSSSTFHPQEGSQGKPDILLSGDDDGRAYFLHPLSENPSDWQYDLVPLLDEGEANIVGQLSVADVDGDGFMELFVPSYFAGKLYVYTMSESDQV